MRRGEVRRGEGGNIQIFELVDIVDGEAQKKSDSTSGVVGE